MKYKNILVAVDGSKAAEKAFDKALDIAKEHQAKLILVHVIDSRIFVTDQVYDNAVMESVNEKVKTLLEGYAKNAENKGFNNTNICIEYGSPKVKIPQTIAENFQADLIVCGATGQNAIEKLIIGSVSEGILRHAHCDVLVVR